MADGDHQDDVLGVSIDDLIAAMADVGGNWERVPLRHAEGREGWEDALVGCLKDVSCSLWKMCGPLTDVQLVTACHSVQFSPPSRNPHSAAFCP
jgi:hypothetical protein